ncbi:metal-dependent hydrolase [Acidaminobacter sp. JC074]|uniref:metal-dependent hydrolase n=1 Tax=Acidaminobacter sp. JC074 TaxID=2530199 RepID=UPI001F112061|nr:metal-dependent hydrolase [Acidaminobacter sp. JC074]MCH4890539.1 metal-dependent hydrolase [Acidaminobacter sp. JC074]
MKVKFIGHATFYFETKNMKAIIDPFITGNPVATISSEDITDLTHIFVTHGHGDHLGDTVELAKKHGAMVITNFEICNYLSNQGVQAHPMHIGGRKTFDGFDVKMTPALHGSAIQTENGPVDGGNPGGFLITVEDKVLYHAGDTGLTMDMKLLEDEHVDLALLPIGGNFTMDIKDAVRAVDFIKPKKVVPMHYNTFGLIEADPNDFKEKIKDAQVLILSPGDTIEI